MSFTKGVLFFITAVFITSCSAVSQVYLRKGYDKKPENMVKHVTILTVYPDGHPGPGKLIVNMAADIVKLKKNYLVHRFEATKGEWKNKCRNYQGVILFTVSSVNLHKGSADIEIKGELFKCGTGELIWSARGNSAGKSKDEDLSNLTEIYKKKFGKEAAIFVAPSFGLLQDIIETMPDPVLTDDEIMEKIDLEGS